MVVWEVHQVTDDVLRVFACDLTALKEVTHGAGKRKEKLKRSELPQQIREPGEGFGSNGGDAIMVDVELLQTGQVPQTEVLQFFNVVLLQVQSHQVAQRGETHRTNLNRERDLVFTKTQKNSTKTRVQSFVQV